MVGLDKAKKWLKQIKEENIVKDGGVPTEADLRVPESTAQNCQIIVYSEADELLPHFFQTSVVHQQPCHTNPITTTQWSFT